MRYSLSHTWDGIAIHRMEWWTVVWRLFLSSLVAVQVWVPAKLLSEEVGEYQELLNGGRVRTIDTDRLVNERTSQLRGPKTLPTATLTSHIIIINGNITHHNYNQHPHLLSIRRHHSAGPIITNIKFVMKGDVPDLVSLDDVCACEGRLDSSGLEPHPRARLTRFW